MFRRTVTRQGWRVASAHGWLERVRRGTPPFPPGVERRSTCVPAIQATTDLVDTGHYFPALAKVDPNIYGTVLVTTDGKFYSAGDTTSEVSIQSISKVFTMAKVIDESGPESLVDNIGLDATGPRSSQSNNTKVRR